MPARIDSDVGFMRLVNMVFSRQQFCMAVAAHQNNKSPHVVTSSAGTNDFTNAVRMCS